MKAMPPKSPFVKETIPYRWWVSSDIASEHFNMDFGAIQINYSHHYYPFYISDINECLNNTGGCAEGCVNTFGSYYCTCSVGHTLQADNRSCAGMWPKTPVMPLLLPLAAHVLDSVVEALPLSIPPLRSYFFKNFYNIFLILLIGTIYFLHRLERN